MSGLCLMIGGVVLLGCSNASDTIVYTLYRNSVVMEGARFHVATFDSTESERYNNDNCLTPVTCFSNNRASRQRFGAKKENFAREAPPMLK
jgi:hypothetical protein